MRRKVAWRGRFRPKNPGKYKGDPQAIIYRSSLELRVMRKFDESDSVEWWASEELIVDYYDPVKQKPRRYFPDFIVKRKDGKTLMVEVKPASQSAAPVHKKGKRRSRVISEELTWANNKAKWEAARKFCARNGWEFVVLTEKDILT